MQGITNSDKEVELIKPPITANAIGALNATLSPKPIVSGNNAKMVVRLVIIIGLIRCWPAATIAGMMSNPRRLC